MGTEIYPAERIVVLADLGRKTPETMGCRPIFKGSATLPYKIQPTLFAALHKARPKPKNKQQPLRAMKPPTQPLTATIRPLPYYNCPYTPAEAALASELRRDFVPKLARRLPGHHLRGFPHDFVVQWVKKQKKTHPFFLKTDIAKFYPSIRHRDLVVGTQIAYRDLLSLDRVPNNIKERYVGRLHSWLNALPTAQGIPLGNPLSAITAPLMLVPLWLEIKRRFNVPMLVFVDDVLIVAPNAATIAQIYSLIHQRLAENYDLMLNVHKTQSGRFASSTVTFCGWTFAGGYAHIDQNKIDRFKERFTDLVHRSKRIELSTFRKRINHRIDGFGNYYKHGNVAKQFEQLDAFARGVIRQWLKTNVCHKFYCNDELLAMGFRTLVGIFDRLMCKKNPARRPAKVAPPAHLLSPQPTAPKTLSQADSAAIAAIQEQIKQLLAIERKQLRLLETIAGAY